MPTQRSGSKLPERCVVRVGDMGRSIGCDWPILRCTSQSFFAVASSYVCKSLLAQHKILSVSLDHRPYHQLYLKREDNTLAQGSKNLMARVTILFCTISKKREICANGSPIHWLGCVSCACRCLCLLRPIGLLPSNRFRSRYCTCSTPFCPALHWLTSGHWPVTHSTIWCTKQGLCSIGA